MIGKEGILQDGFSGDGAAATPVELDSPNGVAVDVAGNISAIPTISVCVL